MRGSSTEIRQQLRNQNIDALLTSAINTVGGRIFPDDLAVIDMDALNQIVSAWRSTHASTYGQVQPNTGVLAEGIADGGGIAPGDNEVIEVVAASMANAGAAPLDVDVKIGDLILNTINIPPGETVKSIDFQVFPLTLSKPLSLKFAVTTGTASDFSAKVAYEFRCQ